MVDEPIAALTDDESWELLEAQHFGRLAMSVAGVPDIVPINYVAHDRCLYFRTGEGTKLLGVTINAEVAFEVDEVTQSEARSVIVHGAARELTHRDEIEFAEALPLRTWVDSRKAHFVEIRPAQVTGRRFVLNDAATA